MDAFVGEVMAFGGNYAPVNWALCQGQTVSISQYQALFALISTTYGGNGTSDFGLPNLQGNIPVGMGQGTGLTNHTLGQSFGVSTVTLGTANLPNHTHTLLADSSNQSPQASPANAYLTSTLTANAAASSGYVAPTGTSTPAVAMAPQTVQAGGGSFNPYPLNNFMPTLGMTMMICLQGLYPTRQ